MPEPDLRSTHFQILRRVFVSRLVDFELLASSGDTTRLAGQFATLFASISLAITLPLLLISGLPQEDRWGMEHFLIATTMAFSGLFGMICWDSIFPERKDLMILGPLPIRQSTLFFAKFAALASTLALGIVALNAFTGVGWALLFEPAGGGFVGLIRSLAAYWITVLAAGLFVFACVLLVHGATSLLLTRPIFLRVSGWLQTAGVILVLAIYILEPSLESISALTAPQNRRLLQFLPSYWFLALYQQLNGSMHVAFNPLVPLAWAGLAIAGVGALLAVLVGYVRILPKIVEEPEIQPSTMRWLWPLLDQRGSVRVAVLAFSWRTLLRSRRHRILLGFLQGLGLTLMLIYLHAPAFSHISGPGLGNVTAAYLIGTLIMTCLSVLSARIIIGIPIELKANWIFQLTQTHSLDDYRRASRRALFTIAMVPAGIVALGVSLWIRGGWAAAVHLAALALLGATLVETASFRLRKLPFTCSWMPGKVNAPVVFFGGLFVGIPLVIAAGYQEFHLLQLRRGWVFLLGGLCIGAAAVRWSAQAFGKTGDQLAFEEDEQPQLLSLNLE